MCENLKTLCQPQRKDQTIFSVWRTACWKLGQKDPLLQLFSHASHIHMPVELKWVFHPIYSYPLCDRVGEATGWYAVCVPNISSLSGKVLLTSNERSTGLYRWRSHWTTFSGAETQACREEERLSSYCHPQLFFCHLPTSLLPGCWHTMMIHSMQCSAT